MANIVILAQDYFEDEPIIDDVAIEAYVRGDHLHGRELRLTRYEWRMAIWTMIQRGYTQAEVEVITGRNASNLHRYTEAPRRPRNRSQMGRGHYVSSPEAVARRRERDRARMARLRAIVREGSNC